MTAVYQAIADVMADLAKEGISKVRRNKEQGYQFRGIDEVYNALAPVLAKHKLVILPNMAERIVTERTTAKGNPLFVVVVRGEFTFVAAKDGSMHTIVTYGEAMDTADKATNKAMSAAYKYACMQAFCIPTEGDNDADAHTHEVAKQPAKAPPPPSDDEADESARRYIDGIKAEINKLMTEEDVRKLHAAEAPARKAMGLTQAEVNEIVEACKARIHEIEAGAKAFAMAAP